MIQNVTTNSDRNELQCNLCKIEAQGALYDKQTIIIYKKLVIHIINDNVKIMKFLGPTSNTYIMAVVIKEVFVNGGISILNFKHYFNEMHY